MTFSCPAYRTSQDHMCLLSVKRTSCHWWDATNSSYLRNAYHQPHHHTVVGCSSAIVYLWVPDEVSSGAAESSWVQAPIPSRSRKVRISSENFGGYMTPVTMIVDGFVEHSSSLCIIIRTTITNHVYLKHSKCTFPVPSVWMTHDLPVAVRVDWTGFYVPGTVNPFMITCPTLCFIASVPAEQIQKESALFSFGI